MNELSEHGRRRDAEHYWADPVYRYLSRLHRSAMTTGDRAEAIRVDELIQKLVERSMPDELYGQLEAEAKADRKRRQQERKKRGRPLRVRASAADRPPSINVADLKKRVFNPHVSRENVIKALEALSPAERKATIAGMPPGLKRKLGTYLKDGRH
jgi:hypothetical protein